MAKLDRNAAASSASSRDFSRRPWLYWGLAMGALILGFADLVRGGETLAPILLVVGYCVLVPLAILR